MRLVVLGFLTVAACGGRQSPVVVAGTHDGITVLRRVPSLEGKPVSLDLVERHGTFKIQGHCLVISAGNVDYTPVFARQNTERIAIADALRRETSEQISGWELFGTPFALKAQKSEVEAFKACGKPLFLLWGVHLFGELSKASTPLRPKPTSMPQHLLPGG